MYAVQKFGRNGLKVAAKSNDGISLDVVQQYFPSILAEHASPTRSDRYKFIGTKDLLGSMQNAGFVPMEISQTGARKSEDQAYRKHMIRFRPRFAVGGHDTQSGYSPEVVLVNSHDGTSSYNLHCGIFRFVCANGLVVADAMFASLSVRHSGRLDDVIDASYRVIEEAPKLTAKVEAMRQTILSPEQRYEFASKAAEIRLGKPVNCHAGQVLSLRRYEDQTHDLWTTFNAVQENLIKGGIRLRASGANWRQVRSVNSINDSLRINKALWALADDTLTALAV